MLGFFFFWLLSAGSLDTSAMISTNEASVLYTFYAPLQAHALHYIALAVIIIGTWFSVIGQLMRYFRWRREFKGHKTPLLSFMASVNNVMWLVCTIGVRSEEHTSELQSRF